MSRAAFIFLVFSLLLGSGFSLLIGTNCNASTCETCTNGCQQSWCTNTNTCQLNLLYLTCSSTSQVSESYDCPIAIPDQNDPETAYDENFTREKITPIIAAVYAHTSEELMACLGNYFDDTLTLYKQYTVPCLGLFNDTCYAYIAIAQSEKLIFLSFRGSSVTEYLFENVNHITFAKKPWPLGGSILTYWYDSFFALWGSGLSDDLKSLLPTYQEQGFKLWVTGHSLGGVLAALNAQYIIAEGLYPETLVKYISFGECRIGDQIFAKQFDEMVPYKYRVINHRDPMTHQPYRLPTESGNTSFWHHHYEVWYPVQMCPGFNYTICHRAEDPNCSDSASANIDPTARDHFYYFGVSLTQWYTSGCNASEICQGYGYLQYLKDLAIYAVDP